MITDALLKFSAAQAVTASAVSTDKADLGVDRDIAQGKPLYAVFTVDEAVTAAGSATVNFQVCTSAAAALTSPNVIAQSDAIGKAELTLNRKPIVIALSSAVLNALPIGQRYLGMQYTVGTGPLTAGKFTAYITDSDVGAKKFYPSGFSVA